jgi:hypothetical protein
MKLPKEKEISQFIHTFNQGNVVVTSYYNSTLHIDFLSDMKFLLLLAMTNFYQKIYEANKIDSFLPIKFSSYA